MSTHMLSTLRLLALGVSHTHHGTLNALVARGLAETYRGGYGTEYRITDAGIALLARS
jgi:DNA-binding PadR family transcriptional regulator